MIGASREVGFSASPIYSFRKRRFAGMTIRSAPLVLVRSDESETFRSFSAKSARSSVCSQPKRCHQRQHRGNPYVKRRTPIQVRGHHPPTQAPAEYAANSSADRGSINPEQNEREPLHGGLVYPRCCRRDYQCDHDAKREVTPPKQRNQLRKLE